MIRPRGEGYDAVIVGGGIGSLTAAAYLARGKGRVLLLEAGTSFAGRAQTMEFAAGFRAPKLAHVVYALDGRTLRELQLADHGLEFANPNMRSVALGPGGKHILLPAAGHRGRAFVAEHASPDACTYRSFHDSAMRFARLLRPLWGGVLACPRSANGGDRIPVLVRRLQLSARDARQLEELSRLSAAAYLDGWFESDALKTALSFDVFPSGLSPQEAGSALVLLWRYAQENRDRQGAVSQVLGGPGALAAALEAAARKAGAELRASVQVSAIIVEKHRAIGVMLADGETIPAGAVLSGLDWPETLLNLVQADSIGFGTAQSMPQREKLATVQVLLALNGPPPFAGLDPADLAARLVIAGRPETASESKSAALHGGFVNELALEVTIPTIADPSLAPGACHVLSALLPYMPAVPQGGWEAHREGLRRRVLNTLEGFAPGLKERVVGHCVVTPDVASPGGTASSESVSTRLLASYEARMRTPIAGLYLCGETAEPVSAVSGRAGRLAAGLVVMDGQAGGVQP